MTGGLAHEIKNPLSTIGLNAQLLSEAIADTEMPADAKSRLSSRTAALRRETDRLRGILTDFLEFAGQLRLDRRPVDINELVTELADFFMPEADRHGVKLILQLAPDVGPGGIPLGPAAVGQVVGQVMGPLARGPIAHADAKLLKQALLNLMLNAVQAMAGTSSPEVPLLGKGTLKISTKALIGEHAEKLVEITVADTGPGMDAELLARLFVPYFTTKSSGSGLGLATSRRIVVEHGGKLDVQSTVGVGTTFTITLPAEKPAA